MFRVSGSGRHHHTLDGVRGVHRKSLSIIKNHRNSSRILTNSQKSPETLKHPGNSCEILRNPQECPEIQKNFKFYQHLIHSYVSLALHIFCAEGWEAGSGRTATFQSSQNELYHFPTKWKPRRGLKLD